MKADNSRPPKNGMFRRIAEDKYYLSREMIRHLLIENLTLKTLLHEKGILSVEDFNQHKERAAKILDDRIKNHLEELEASSPMAKLMSTLEKPTQSDDVASSPSS